MTRHPWRTAALVGALLGLLVGGFMMYAAWQHNPQGEFHDEHGVHWRDWFLLGLSWFVPVFVMAALVCGAVLASRGRKSDPSSAGL